MAIKHALQARLKKQGEELKQMRLRVFKLEGALRYTQALHPIMDGETSPAFYVKVGLSRYGLVLPNGE